MHEFNRSRLFSPWTDPDTGVTTYILSHKVAPVQEVFYFVNDSMSADGRYIFSADNRRELSRWDSEHDFAHVSMAIPVLGRNISAHPQKSQIIVNRPCTVSCT